MTTKKIEPCKLAPKHTWTFIKNVQVSSGRATSKGRMVSVKKRSLMKCPCGARKYGLPMREEDPT